MTTPKLRWGILSTAHIGRKNWQAIFDSGNGVVTAVTSRKLASAERFIKECQLTAPFAAKPRALGSYEELIAAPDIDALYIPLPTTVRQEWVIRAAAAGKHIVCEKPCAVTSAGLREMLDACRRHRVQFMDGVMFRHGERLGRMRAVLDDGMSVGPLQRISTAFSFRGPADFLATNIRAQAGLEPLGCLGDLGWYCIQLSLWACGWQLPRTVTGRMLSAHTADGGPLVPTEFSGELIFADGLTADFSCSFLAELQQWAKLTGPRGSLHLDDFVLPPDDADTAFEIRPAAGASVRRITVAERGRDLPPTQQAKLFHHFAAQVQSGALDESWPHIALQTQRVLDACLASSRHGSQPCVVE